MERLFNIVHFIRARLRLFFALVAINLVLTLLVFYHLLADNYQAQVVVEMRHPDLRFQDNSLDAYLFEQGKYAEFIYILLNDSLALDAAKALNLADHYGLHQGAEERLKTASEILKRRVQLNPEEFKHFFSITISYEDADPRMAEDVLLYITSKVREYHHRRVNSDAFVTKGVASAHIRSANQRIERLAGNLDSLYAISNRKEYLNFKIAGLGEAYRNEVFQREHLKAESDKVEDVVKSEKYQAYTVINKGVRRATPDIFMAVMIALVCNIVVLFIQLQLVYSINYFIRYLKGNGHDGEGLAIN